MNFKEKNVNRSAYANVLKTYQHVKLYVGKYARVTGPLRTQYTITVFTLFSLYRQTQMIQ